MLVIPFLPWRKEEVGSCHHIYVLVYLLTNKCQIWEIEDDTEKCINQRKCRGGNLHKFICSQKWNKGIREWSEWSDALGNLFLEHLIELIFEHPPRIIFNILTRRVNKLYIILRCLWSYINKVLAKVYMVRSRLFNFSVVAVHRNHIR